MTIQEIVNTTRHRPWKIPTSQWKFYQEWNHAIFFHYRVNLTSLKKFIPKELEIHLHEGEPWVSVVAFTMENMRPRNLPAIPYLSDFHEINIRTYIKSNHKTGVYFLSIEGGNSLSCKLAKGISDLPYRYSKIKRTKNLYEGRNLEFNDQLNFEFTIGKKVKEKSEIDKWLTERYALFQDTAQSINEFEIHHVEWPIHEIELQQLNVNYPRFESLLNNSPDRMHYSEGVKVLAWGKNKREKASYDIP